VKFNGARISRTEAIIITHIFMGVRQMRTQTVLVHAVLILASTTMSAAETLSGSTSTWISNDMLNAMDGVVQSQRRPIVDAAIKAFPGSSETLLLGLANKAYLSGLWESRVGQWVSVDLPRMNGGYGGRNLGMNVSGEEPASLGIGQVEYVPLMTFHTSPLLLDLNGDGNAGVPGGQWQPHKGLAGPGGPFVAFDINGDGFVELCEWVDGSDGLLVDPVDPAKIMRDPVAGPVWKGHLSGLDLLGTSEGYGTGFSKLMLRRDRDGDGVVVGVELDGLYVWIDRDVSGTIDAGELSSVAEHGIRSLLPPEKGSDVGSFTVNDDLIPRAMWDWWPSYALAKRMPDILPGGSMIGSEMSRQFHDTPAPLAKYGIREGDGSKDDLVHTAGFNWDSALMGCFTPDGSRLVLHDRSADPHEIAAGLSSRLFVVQELEGDLQVIKIGLPLFDINQLVCDSNGSVIVVGNSGAKIVRVDLNTSSVGVLMEPMPGKSGFRAGDRAWRHNGDAYLTGYFYNELQQGGSTRIVRLIGSSEGGFTFETAADLDEIRRTVRTAGTIAEEYLLSGEMAFFIVRTGTGEWSLVVYRGGVVDTVDTPVSLGGMSGDGCRVLYFKEQPLPDGGVQAIVYDACSGESFSLGAGDYSYPYLTGNGTIAIVSSIDWTDGSMTLFSTQAAGKGSLRKLRAFSGIGVVRVSDNGKRVGYLGPQGLLIGCPYAVGMDLKWDCQIDFEDMGGFAVHWGREDCDGPIWCGGADNEPDGDVDFDDLVVLARSWLSRGQ
jgi:hypothetical protein